MRARLESWADYIGGLGLALLAVTGILYILQRPQSQVIALGVMGLVLIALYVWIRPQQVGAAVTSRSAQFGAGTVVISLIFVAAVVLGNLVSNKYNNHWDLTVSQSESLSPLTIKALQDLKEPIQAKAFYATLRPNPQDLTDVKNRLDEYVRYTDKLTYTMIDPQLNPQLANDYKAFDGMIVFERGTRRENALNSDEQTLTNALLKVTQDKQPVLYFTTGHGERGLEDSGNNGFSLIKSGIETDNYSVASLNLKTITDTLPADLSALVIAGPRQKFDADEVQRVKDYLGKNGRVFVMIDPQTDTGLEPVLKDWGLNVRNDLLLDPRFGLQGQLQTPVINSYGSHAITQDLAGLSSYYVSVRSLFADATPPTGRTATALLTSSDISWGETDFAGLANNKAAFDPNVDAKGPLNFGYAVDAGGASGGRLVVLGNSSFVTNGNLRQQTANPIFFGNVIHWLAGQEDLIAIPPKTNQNTLFLGGQDGIFVLASSCMLIPGVLVLIGAIIWWRRR